MADDLQQRLDAIVGGAHRARHAARLKLDAAQEAYAAWGRGELDDDGLRAVLDTLHAP